MELLSKDDLFNIGVNLDLEDLLSFCKTSKNINNNLCVKDSLWLHKIKQSFPSLSTTVMNLYRNDRSWKDYYIQDLYPTLNKKSQKYGDPNRVLIHSFNRTDLVIAALDLGADVHTNDDEALRYASEDGKYETVKLLIERGADVQANNNFSINWASFYGHLDVVKLLIDSGADIQTDNNFAVRWASRNGRYNVVKLLIESGADVHADNNFAVNWASHFGHLDVVKLLIDHGAPEPIIYDL